MQLFSKRMLKVHQAQIAYQKAIRAYVAELDKLTSEDEDEEKVNLLSNAMKNQFW